MLGGPMAIERLHKAGNGRTKCGVRHFHKDITLGGPEDWPLEGMQVLQGQMSDTGLNVRLQDGSHAFGDVPV